MALHTLDIRAVSCLLTKYSMAEAQANSLLGGYHDEFVNEVEDELQCAICQLPLNEPILTKCGHRFCRRCLDGHFKRLENDGQLFSCPVDRIQLVQDKDIFADKATERKILSLIIKCGSKGCQWTGELRSKENHLESCPMVIISCPYDQVGCTTKFQRREVESHLQSAVRLHLDLTCGKMNNMQEEFKETIRKLEEKYEKVTRKLEEKVGETKKEVEKQKEVTRRLEEKFGETKREVEEKYEEVTRKLEDKVNVPDHENRLTQFPEEYTWKISRFSKMQSQAKSGEKTAIFSSPFYYYGYKFKLELLPNGVSQTKGTHLSIYFCIMKGDYDANLSWPFQKIVQLTLIDQQEDAKDRENIVQSLKANPKNNKTVERPLTDRNIGRGFRDFVPLTKLTERRYIVDDTIFIQVQVAPIKV